MSKIVTCLRFDRGEAQKAATFYAATFPDSHLGHVRPAASEPVHLVQCLRHSISPQNADRSARA